MKIEGTHHGMAYQIDVGQGLLLRQRENRPETQVRRTLHFRYFGTCVDHLDMECVACAYSQSGKRRDAPIDPGDAEAVMAEEKRLGIGSFPEPEWSEIDALVLTPEGWRMARIDPHARSIQIWTHPAKARREPLEAKGPALTGSPEQPLLRTRRTTLRILPDAAKEMKRAGL